LVNNSQIVVTSLLMLTSFFSIFLIFNDTVVGHFW
jgi:hypothetical protein